MNNDQSENRKTSTDTKADEVCTNKVTSAQTEKICSTKDDYLTPQNRTIGTCYHDSARGCNVTLYKSISAVYVVEDLMCFWEDKICHRKEKEKTSFYFDLMSVRIAHTRADHYPS